MFHFCISNWRSKVLALFVARAAVAMIFVSPVTADQCEVAKLLASDGGAQSEFGFLELASVSIGGDTAVIGASLDDENGTESGAAYIYHFDGSIWTQQQKLLPSDGAAYDRFGVSVSLSGDVVVIGAPRGEKHGMGPGSVYVFRFDGTTWIEEQKLLASDGAEDDEFGGSVAISGDVAVIGAESDENENGIYAGAAYVYRFDGLTWTEEQKLLASDGDMHDSLGKHVSVDGDVAIIGAPDDEDAGLFSGSAYIYRFDAFTWIEEQKLLASDSNPDDRFGDSVSVDGDTVLIGARDGGLSDSGSAFVFRFNGEAWLEEQMLLPSDGSSGDQFGGSVSLDGDTALIGARFGGPANGSAYVFRFNGTTWMEEQTLVPSQSTTSFGYSVSLSGDVALIGAPFGSLSYVFRFDGRTWIEEQQLLVAPAVFGISVSVSGDHAVIGSPFHSHNGIVSGSAYIYGSDASTWLQDQKLLAPDAASADEFGRSVAINGDIIVIGAPGDDDNESDSGSAYVFRRNETTWVQEQKLLPTDGDINDRFGESVSVSGDVIVIGALFDDDNDFSGSAYVYRFNGTTWVEEQKLLPSNSQGESRFGASVSVSGDAALIGDPFDAANGFLAGAAYVFRYDGKIWFEEQKLLLFPGDHQDMFGRTVSLSGDAALIGGTSTDADGDHKGLAYVFRFDGTSWVEEQQLAFGGSPFDLFGSSVSLDGDTAVIGARLDDDDDNGYNSGSIYIFKFNGTSWFQDQQLLASDGAAGDQFGSSVSVSGDTAIIGAPFDDDDGFDSGSAYAFDLTRCPQCPADVNNDTVVGPADLAEMLASWGVCGHCPADIEPHGGDGVVWPPDLEVLLAAWGQCPQ